MSNPLPERIINRIKELIESKALPARERDASLNEAASEAWSILFPEDRGQSHNPPGPDARMKRWESVRAQLSGSANSERILRVLESPATGERFHWLD